MTHYDTTHGGPYNRGMADSYYRRAPDPHYWPDGTYFGERVERADMTEDEIEAYRAGYRYNDELGDYKDYR